MVDELIAERGVRSPFIRLAKDGELLRQTCYLGPGGFGAEVTDQVDSAKVLAEFAGGATIVLQGLHRLWPPLIEFVRNAVDDLGRPVQANAYVTPANSRGFDAHYDVHDVFVLQTSGTKRWIVHEPVHADPLTSQPWTQHRAAIAERVGGAPVLDTVLQAGDALYLPRGWVHSARALKCTSIHLTIGVSSLTALDVARAVVDQLATTDSFRRSLPMGTDPADRDLMTAAASKVIAEMADTLRDHASVLGEATAGQLSRRHAARTRPAAVRPLAAMTASERAGEVTVQWRRGLYATVEESGGRVLLRLRDKEMSFPASCSEAIAALRSRQLFEPGTLPGLDSADAEVLLRRLLREGVVEPVSDATVAR
jgi:hypothetical protein